MTAPAPTAPTAPPRTERPPVPPLPPGLREALAAAVGEAHVLTGDAVPEDDTHDECLTVAGQWPAAVVRPGSTEEVAAVLRVAARAGLPVTARGSGTGLSGGAVPPPGGLVVSSARMARVLEVDVDNGVAVVQPGVTLAELDAATAPHGLAYQVAPGESSASLGGGVATNAGGMRAVAHGVTRHNVLGVEAVLASGEVIRTGGRFVKSSSGYDLTQLIVGSEGTLALVTEVTVRLVPRAAHAATVLATFGALDGLMRTVPRVVGSGLGPVIVEYVDTGTMRAITELASLDLGVPEAVRAATEAYLVVVLEGRDAARIDEDVEVLGQLLLDRGAGEVYVLPAPAGRDLIAAREKAFWVAKAAGAHDIVDVVVPRAAMPEFFARAEAVAREHGSVVRGCGHAGDGNVHLSVYQPDAGRRAATLHALFEAGMALGGAISGEHGLGRAKAAHFAELADPATLALLRRVKAAFDPDGLLNPGTVYDPHPARPAGATDRSDA